MSTVEVFGFLMFFLAVILAALAMREYERQVRYLQGEVRRLRAKVVQLRGGAECRP